MSGKTLRVQKVEKQLREIISECLPEMIYLESNILVSVVRVEAAGDLRSAKVFVSVFPDDRASEVLSELEDVRADIQDKISKKIRMKYLPKLRWILDDSVDQLVKMSEILKKD